MTRRAARAWWSLSSPFSIRSSSERTGPKRVLHRTAEVLSEEHLKAPSAYFKKECRAWEGGGDENGAQAFSSGIGNMRHGCSFFRFSCQGRRNGCDDIRRLVLSAPGNLLVISRSCYGEFSRLGSNARCKYRRYQGTMAFGGKETGEPSPGRNNPMGQEKRQRARHRVDP